ncbi:MAG: 3-isopropylmalate dehydrogenase [Pseudomonadota bacterium]|nr:3-isopropylmalate dehydrogenase [Pseudomonadota bacterium]
MSKKIIFLPGDGIGPEVTSEVVKIFNKINNDLNLKFLTEDALIGGAALDATGSPLPDDTLNLCQEAEAIFLGAVGGEKWNNNPVHLRPESGLLPLRKKLKLFANLRPIKIHPKLISYSPIKEQYLQNVDILILRELTGGIYFGKRNRTKSKAFDTCEYDVAEIERICRRAGQFARQRKNKVTSIDKHNVLDTSRLWRATADRIFADEFSDVELEHIYIDAATMHIINRPNTFDVMVTDNMFGDIISDEASMLVGSLGLLPSASLGEGSFGLYEPIHGSAPDIAGKGIANPTGAILSLALLFRYSLGLESIAEAIENAVYTTFSQQHYTADLSGLSNTSPISTSSFGECVLSNLSI